MGERYERDGYERLEREREIREREREMRHRCSVVKAILHAL